jgi:hypothetical protein
VRLDACLTRSDGLDRKFKRKPMTSCARVRTVKTTIRMSLFLLVMDVSPCEHARPDVHLSCPNGPRLKRGIETFLAHFLRISLPLARFLFGFSWKNHNRRRFNCPNSNPISDMWSTKLDLCFYR